MFQPQEFDFDSCLVQQQQQQHFFDRSMAAQAQPHHIAGSAPEPHVTPDMLAERMASLRTSGPGNWMLQTPHPSEPPYQRGNNSSFYSTSSSSLLSERSKDHSQESSSSLSESSDDGTVGRSSFDMHVSSYTVKERPLPVKSMLCPDFSQFNGPFLFS